MRLSWTSYRGGEAFAAYRVLRKVQGLEAFDTLIVVDQQSTTTFTDTSLTANTAYSYQVTVVNAAGFEAASTSQSIAGFIIRPVELQRVTLDETRGAAQLRWRRFDGVRFAGYRVERRSAEEQDFAEVGRIAVIDDTTYTDAGLSPDISYFYRVVTLAAGAEWASSRSAEIGYSLDAPQLISVEVDGRTGLAQLLWTAYAGPEFESYEILRRRGSVADFDFVSALSAVGDTTFTDTLEPDTDYAYLVRLRAAGTDHDSNVMAQNRFDLAPVRLIDADVSAEDGTIELTWSRFAGPGFESYSLVREVPETGEILTFPSSTSAEDTVWTDEAAFHGVTYIYTVNTRALGRILASNTRVRQLRLPAVVLAPARYDSSDASVSLAWTAYGGPRFAAYAVQRSELGRVPETVARLEDVGQTTWVDTSGLRGNTAFTFQVSVETDRGEIVPSVGQPVRFHGLIDIWPLALEADDVVRLYSEPDNRIAALIAGSSRVRLLRFTTDGAVEQDTVLIDLVAPLIVPRSVAMALDDQGRRYVSRATDEGVTIQVFEADGSIITESVMWFEDAFPQGLTTAEATVLGEIGLTASEPGTAFSGSRPPTRARFDNILVTQGDQELYREGFDEGRPDDWDELSERFQFEDDGMIIDHVSTGLNVAFFRAVKTEDSWQDFRLQVDVTPVSGRGGIWIGATGGLERFSTFSLWLEPSDGQTVAVGLHGSRRRPVRHSPGRVRGEDGHRSRRESPNPSRRGGWSPRGIRRDTTSTGPGPG